jgi:hypothetical protein
MASEATRTPRSVTRRSGLAETEVEIEAVAAGMAFAEALETFERVEAGRERRAHAPGEHHLLDRAPIDALEGVGDRAFPRPLRHQRLVPGSGGNAGGRLASRGPLLRLTGGGIVVSPPDDPDRPHVGTTMDEDPRHDERSGLETRSPAPLRGEGESAERHEVALRPRTARRAGQSGECGEPRDPGVGVGEAGLAPRLKRGHGPVAQDHLAFGAFPVEERPSGPSLAGRAE